ncbi:MAG TPA: hypothetical protein VEU78_01390 [Steroidobacteraceae bacterium]|nr:hypothetical protein [Steroidobacteraceae bacterium]
MIVTQRFIYLHLHKTAGSFIDRFLLRFMPDARRIANNLPRRLAPASHAHLPALGFVRSPWSYYAAWYGFQSRRRQSNALFDVLSDGGRLDFEHTIANMLELGTTGARLDALIAALPRSYTNTGLNLPGFALEPIRASGRGFYSFLYRYMYDAPGFLHVRRVDRLANEWLSMLNDVGQPVTMAMQRYLEEAARAEQPAPGSYAQHYGSALRELVAERDADIIARHDYRFGE